MPEYKAVQDSFTITFDPDVDQVDATNLYIAKWREFISNYQESIAKYPFLKEKVENEFGLAKVSKNDVIFFQQLVDAVNNLLDTDFIAFKRALFPGTWKLGIGIVEVSSSSISYLLYRIPYGKNPTILSKFDGSLFDLLGNVPNSFIAKTISADQMQNAAIEGSKLVLDFVVEAVKQRSLTVRGKLLAQELIFQFIDEFWFCLGLDKDDAYSLPDVSRALNRYLPFWYSKAQQHVGFQVTSFESFATLFKPEEQERIHLEIEKALSEQAPIPPVRLYSARFSFKAIFESLEYLRAAGVEQIRRLYIPRSKNSKRGNFIWSGYDTEGLKYNVDLILKESVEEYREFVSANNIALRRSDYLSDEKSFIFAFDYQGCAENNQDFWLTTIVMDNPDNRLEKVTIVDKSFVEAATTDRQMRPITKDGYDYKIIRMSQSAGDELFGETPMLDRVYSMLKTDLKLNYDIEGSWQWLDTLD